MFHLTHNTWCRHKWTAIVDFDDSLTITHICIMPKTHITNVGEVMHMCCCGDEIDSFGLRHNKRDHYSDQ